VGLGVRLTGVRSDVGLNDTCFGRMISIHDLRRCKWVLWEVVGSCTGES
jgi:hypothetical protein